MFYSLLISHTYSFPYFLPYKKSIYNELYLWYNIIVKDCVLI